MMMMMMKVFSLIIRSTQNVQKQSSIKAEHCKILQDLKR